MEQLCLLKGKNSQKYVGYSEISKKYVTSEDVEVNNLYNYYFTNKMIYNYCKYLGLTFSQLLHFYDLEEVLYE